MSLTVEVTKISQDINLDGGDAENFVLIQLPNGGVVRARINEEAAQAIMDCFVNGSNAQRQIQQEQAYIAPTTQDVMDAYQSAPTGFHSTTAPDGTPALEFGSEVAQAMPTAPVPRGAVKLVGKDEMGYPIMRAVGNGSADPGELSTGSMDEDGVGQL